MTLSEPERCGYVGLVGRPNVGKSTLMNHLLRQKIAITSRRPQTTRRLMLGVDTEGTDQAIYVDTPGIHEPGGREMNRYMVRAATSILSDVDVLVMVVEHTRWTEEDALVAGHVKQSSARCIVAMNKIDLLKDKRQLLPAIERLRDMGLFEEIVPISAERAEGLDGLRREIFRRLPVQPHVFPADQVTDQPERFLVAEIIREKLMRRLGDEIPHRATVIVESFQEGDGGVDIAANIVVERPGQKRIVIGKGGSKLKQIGSEARADIEQLLDRRVMLRLWVKVRSGWTNDVSALKQLGYD
jgi:GTP-binding protein Era